MAERLLWNALSELRKENGLRFRRQHPIYPYYADFACVKALFIVEIDGMSHDSRQAYDAERDAEIESKGWKILRFTNDDVKNNLEGVVRTILDLAKKRVVAHPLPLP